MPLSIRSRSCARRRNLPLSLAEPPLDPLDGGSEDVAAAAHCFDYCRLLRSVLDLASKPADLDINHPTAGSGLAIAQLIAAQHVIGVFDESGEQIEFAGGQPDLLIRGTKKLAA